SCRLGIWHQLRSRIRGCHRPLSRSTGDGSTSQCGLPFSTLFCPPPGSDSHRAGLFAYRPVRIMVDRWRVETSMLVCAGLPEQASPEIQKAGRLSPAILAEKLSIAELS